jgi:hypothetical protein
MSLSRTLSISHPAPLLFFDVTGTEEVPESLEGRVGDKSLEGVLRTT